MHLCRFRPASRCTQRSRRLGHTACEVPFWSSFAMALARIFTRYPQQATALSDELQESGYRVEVLSPEQTPASPAHLEIQLEDCEPADILRRAEELASQLRADIAVAPGALPVFNPQQEPDSALTAATPELIAGTIETAIQPAALENEPSNCE